MLKRWLERRVGRWRVDNCRTRVDCSCRRVLPWRAARGLRAKMWAFLVLDGFAVEWWTAWRVRCSSSILELAVKSLPFILDALHLLLVLTLLHLRYQSFLDLDLQFAPFRTALLFQLLNWLWFRTQQAQSFWEARAESWHDLCGEFCAHAGRGKYSEDREASLDVPISARLTWGVLSTQVVLDACQEMGHGLLEAFTQGGTDAVLI